MKDWPGPDDDSGDGGYLFMLEYWVVAGAMIFGVAMIYGPALVRLLGL